VAKPLIDLHVAGESIQFNDAANRPTAPAAKVS
jgi:hypothetical protein